jgi:serine phosphatase RsbU (regulator of sigma subunit)
MRLSFKLLLISEAVLLVAVLVLVVPVWRAMGRQVVENMQNELKAIASTAALNIDGDAHALIRTPGDAERPEFDRIREQLEFVRQANGIAVNHIYTFYQDADRMRFAVMLNPKEQLFVGDSYPLQDLMRPVLEEGTMEATRLYEDEHGEWISAYAPIKNRAGAVVGLLEVDKGADEYFEEFNHHTRLTIGVGLVALALSSIMGWVVLQRLVIHPVSQIREGMLALGRHDFGYKVNVQTNDELQDLGQTLNHIASQLDLAQVVQQSFFPRKMPEIAGYRLAGRSIPCDATGGDYYDAFRLPNGEVAVLVADVSGHGLGASLLMASCRAALRGLSQTGLAPGDLVKQLNHMLLDELRDGRFITIIYGVISPDGTFVYSNYGHSPAVVVQNGVVQSLPSHRPPLGIDIDFPDEPRESKLHLNSGDRVFLASDGLVEALDTKDEQLGLEPVEAIVQRQDFSAEDIVDKLHALQVQHCGGASTTDDVTLLCVDHV